MIRNGYVDGFLPTMSATSLHDLPTAHYANGTAPAWICVEATLARLFHNHPNHVIFHPKRMKPTSNEAKEQLATVIPYLSNHKHRIIYRTARHRRHHIASSAIQNAPKFIEPVRLKRSPARHYPPHAHNIHQLRCAKSNGTSDQIQTHNSPTTQDQQRSHEPRYDRTAVNTLAPSGEHTQASFLTFYPLKYLPDL